MKTKIMIGKIKPNKFSKFYNWIHSLNSKNQAGAIKSLQQEGIDLESWHFFEHDGEMYYACFAQSNGKATQLSGGSKTSNLDVDIQHRKMLAECIAEYIPASHITTLEI